jgi:tellurite resistance protein
MMATSFADGKIQEEEILRIADVYRQIFASDLEVTWIRETANSMLKKDFDIAAALGAKHKLIESSLKPLILEAASSVAAADGFLDEKERDILFAMARALQMTENEIAAVSRKLEVLDA